MKKFILSTLLMAGMASAADQAMIVFDASGSMWGRVDGKEKITVAKDVLKQVVGQWNPQTQLGLMAYGHRQKGDCNDIEVLVPVSGFDKQALLQQVKGISPKGKTPISRSLQQAADTLRYTEDKATVILISDGKETCDADPCATAKALKEKGIDFVTHVIGFDVDKDTDAQLSCVAKATGGQYFSAKNAQALNQAMQTVVKTVQKTPPQPKPKPTASKYNLHIKAFETEGGKQVKAHHQIFRPIDEEENEHMTNCSSYKKEACKERLPVGEYFVVSTYNHYKIKMPFTITTGENTELNIIMGETGKVQITAFEAEGGKQVKTHHQIFRPIDEEENEHMTNCSSYKKEACKERLPVGEYFVVSTYNHFKIKTPFTVTAGQTTNLNVIMGQTGKVEITAFETEGGKQVKTHHQIFRPIDEEENEHMTNCSSYKKETCKEQLPVGEYFVVSTYNHFKIKTPFTVTAGQTTNLNVIMGQTGKVEITAFETEGGKQVKTHHQIFRPIDEEENEHMTNCSSYKKETCKEQLPVGEYFVVSTYNHFKIKTPFTVTAGQTTNLNVIMGQTGKVEITAFETEGGKQVKTHHQIFRPIDEEENEHMTNCSSYKKETCKERLPVGKYFVKSSYGYIELTTPFTITAGQTTQLVIDFSRQNKPVDKKALIDADKETSQNAQPSSQPGSQENSKTTSTAIQTEPKTTVQDNNQNTAQTNKQNTDPAMALVGALVKSTMDDNQSAQQGGEAEQLVGALQMLAGQDSEAMQEVQKIQQAVSGVKNQIGNSLLDMYKQALTAALPYMEISTTCYKQSKLLAQIKSCDDFANQGVKAAAEKLQDSTSIPFPLPKTISHSEWNEEIQAKTVARGESDITRTKATLACIDQGVGIDGLKACVAGIVK